LVEAVLNDDFPAKPAQLVDDVFDHRGMSTVDEPIGIAVVPSRVEVQAHVEDGRDRVDGAEGQLVETAVLCA
jgi:hypothetical protein